MVERLTTAGWVVLAAMRAQTRTMRRSPFPLVLGAGQPVVLLLVLAGAARPVGSGAAGHIVAGVGMTALWGSTIWAAGGILRAELAQGTLPAVVTGLRPPQLVLLGKCLGATLRLVAVIVVTIVVTTLVVRLPLTVARPGWLAVGLVVVVASGTASGMLLSCVFLVTRNGPAWASALMYPVFILGGILIPAELLPPALRWISAIVPLHWAHELFTAALRGTPVAFPLAMLTGLTVVHFALAVRLFSGVVDVGRSRGTLDLA